MKDQNQDCEVCYKIKCKNCGWEASDLQVRKIASGEITYCPACGWKPGSVNIL